MGSRWITWGLFVLILLGFVMIFGARLIAPEIYVKVGKGFETVERLAAEGNWRMADSEVGDLRRSWEKVRFPIMLNYAEEDYSLFMDTLTRLESAVRLRDGREAAGLSRSGRRLWRNFLRAVPEP